MATTSTAVTYQGVDNVYVNTIVYNDGKTFIPCKFQISNDQAIIGNPSDYYLTVVRFTVPGNNIPLFVFNQTPNFYTITLSYLAFDYQVSLIYIPDNTQDEFTVFSYQHFTDMINVALATSFATLKAANPGAAAVYPPVLIYNPLNQLFSLLVPTTGYTGANPVGIYFSQNVNKFFESFESIFNGLYTTNGKDVKMSVEDTGNNTLYVQAPGANANGIFYSSTKLPATTYYAMSQEFSTLYLWNELQTITIQSTGIPTRNEYLNTHSNTGNNNQSTILTDFVPSVVSGPEIRSQFQYIPSGQYRLIDLQSNTPIYSLSMEFKYSVSSGDLNDILLSPGDSATCKLLFTRKGSGFQTYDDLAHGTQFNHTHLENGMTPDYNYSRTNNRGGNMNAPSSAINILRDKTISQLNKKHNRN